VYEKKKKERERERERERELESCQLGTELALFGEI